MEAVFSLVTGLIISTAIVLALGMLLTPYTKDD
jgi:hypothetical protein